MFGGFDVLQHGDEINPRVERGPEIGTMRGRFEGRQLFAQFAIAGVLRAGVLRAGVLRAACRVAHGASDPRLGLKARRSCTRARLTRDAMDPAGTPSTPAASS